MAYPRGWSMVSQVELRKERWPGGYNRRGIALVYPGQEVQADQPVIRLERVRAIDDRLASPLSTRPLQQQQGLSSTMKAGDRPSLNRVQGEELISAGLGGRVVDVTQRGGVLIETRAALIRGVAGVGLQVAGPLCYWRAGASPLIPPGALLVFATPINLATLRHAQALGASGVIASSISLHDFETFLGVDAIRLFSSSDVELYQSILPPLTVLFTEGFGGCLMLTDLSQALERYDGSFALLSGATSIQASLFPELIISLPPQVVWQKSRPATPDLQFVRGARVRVSGGDCVGVVGEIVSIFPHKVVFASGVRARSARLRLEDGTFFIAPLNSIERIV